MEEEDIFKALFTRTCNTPMISYRDIEFTHRHVKLMLEFLQSKIKLTKGESNHLLIEVVELG